MVVLVMGLEVLTKHIGLDNEDKLGYDVGSFDGMTNEKICRSIARKSLEETDRYRYGGTSMRSIKLNSRQRRGFSLI